MALTESMTEVEGTLDRHGLRTWYRVVGNGRDPRPAVVVCHGGPGATHDYLDNLTALAGDGRRVVFYDQVGGGRSSHHPDVPPGFWTPGLFADELEALVTHLALDSYHLLGQSWGAMLGIEHALRRPSALRSLVLANGLASVPRYLEGTARLVAALPGELAAALVTRDARFDTAIEEFSRRHRLRRTATPDALARTNAAIDADPTVYLAMVGSEFRPTGTLLTWDVTHRLGEIAVPTLLLSGRHDEVVPEVVDALHRGIAGSTWVVFEDGSHLNHLEEPDRFVHTVTDFLNRTEESQP